MPSAPFNSQLLHGELSKEGAAIVMSAPANIFMLYMATINIDPIQLATHVAATRANTTITIACNAI